MGTGDIQYIDTGSRKVLSLQKIFVTMVLSGSREIRVKYPYLVNRSIYLHRNDEICIVHWLCKY